MPSRIRSVTAAAAANTARADGSAPTWSPTWKTSNPASSARRAQRSIAPTSVVVAWKPKRNGLTTDATQSRSSHPTSTSGRAGAGRCEPSGARLLERGPRPGGEIVRKDRRGVEGLGEDVARARPRATAGTVDQHVGGHRGSSFVTVPGPRHPNDPTTRRCPAAPGGSDAGLPEDRPGLNVPPEHAGRGDVARATPSGRAAGRAACWPAGSRPPAAATG